MEQAVKLLSCSCGGHTAIQHNGAFEQYFFVINNYIKHADAKAYNRHVATGMMKPGELILVGQEVLGLLLLENYQDRENNL
jgi:hypothetical protein